MIKKAWVLPSLSSYFLPLYIVSKKLSAHGPEFFLHLFLCSVMWRGGNNVLGSQDVFSALEKGEISDEQV